MTHDTQGRWGSSDLENQLLSEQRDVRLSLILMFLILFLFFWGGGETILGFPSSTATTTPLSILLEQNVVERLENKFWPNLILQIVPKSYFENCDKANLIPIKPLATFFAAACSNKNKIQYKKELSSTAICQCRHSTNFFKQQPGLISSLCAHARESETHFLDTHLYSRETPQEGAWCVKLQNR